MRNLQGRALPCEEWKGKGGGPTGHHSELQEGFAHEGLRGHIKMKKCGGD